MTQTLSGNAFTLASVQRDFTEWRQGRTHYAVWAIDADTPAIRAASMALQGHLTDHLLAGYQRQPHVTLELCGFPAAAPRLADDYSDSTLQRQITALQAARLAPFALEIGNPNSFTSAAYLAVDDGEGGIRTARNALRGATNTGDGFPYTPHVTCGLYRGEFHLPTLLQAMDTCRPLAPLRLQVDKLTLMSYEAAVIGGPLCGLCEFDLATQRVRILDRQLMERLFGRN